MYVPAPWDVHMPPGMYTLPPGMYTLPPGMYMLPPGMYVYLPQHMLGCIYLHICCCL